MTEYLQAEDVFRLVREHMRGMPRPAISDEYVGMYRTPDRLKCPIGALIPDELYNPEYEGIGVEVLLRKLGAVDLFGKEIGKGIDELLVDIQDIHDGVNPERWMEELDCLEERWESWLYGA
jgi:hypothetical protein